MTPRQLVIRSVIGGATCVVVVAALWLGYRLFIDVHGIQPVAKAEAFSVFQSYDAAHGGKQVALTFDDGPRVATETVMDVLEENNVHGTFFLVGASVLAHPDIAKSIVDRGFGIAAHSFTHGREVHVSQERLEWELGATKYAIETATGVSPRMYRPPFQLDIASTITSPSRAGDGPIKWVFDYGYIPVGADADSYDWTVQLENDIVTQVKLSLHRGNILVFHDTEQTAAALPRVLALLDQEGYEVVALDDLIGLSGAAVEASTPTGLGAVAAWLDRVAVFGGATTFRLLVALLSIAVALVILRLFLVGSLLFLSYVRPLSVTQRGSRALVSIVIPAWNEEANIEATMKSVIRSRSVKAEVIVVDDGSTDRTFEIASRVAQETATMRVTVLRKQNGGKASALNVGIQRARGTVIVCLDADTIFMPDTVAYLIAPLKDPAVGAVSGKVSIAGAMPVLARMQQLEYLIGQNVQKRAFQMANALSVIPGAVGAWRKRDIRLAGGVPTDTLVEDHDLTLAILALGRRIVYEPRATAYTEAPQTISAFVKQRVRWVQGAMQCAVKYRAALWSRKAPWGLRLAVINAFAYDFFLPFFYPLVDLILLGSIVTGTFSALALPLLVFVILDFGIAYLAVKDEEQNDYTLITILLMRILYRHLLFYAFFISWARFIEGRSAGWQKHKRRGDAQRQFFGETITTVDNAVAGHLPPVMTSVARSTPTR